MELSHHIISVIWNISLHILEKLTIIITHFTINIFITVLRDKACTFNMCLWVRVSAVSDIDVIADVDSFTDFSNVANSKALTSFDDFTTSAVFSYFEHVPVENTSTS